MTEISELVKEIQAKQSEINRYEMAHYNSETRSGKIRYTKKIKQAQKEKAIIREKITALQEAL